MSYDQAMRWQRKHPRGGKPQYMGFSTLADNERRRSPWLGGSWFEPGRDEARAEFIQRYEAETERMLRENPDLILV